MNKFFFNPISIIVFILVTLTFSLSLRETGSRAAATKKELQALETSVHQLQVSASQSAQLVAERQGEFVREKVAREELLLQKPNELVVQLPPLTPKPTVSPTPTQDRPLKAWKQAIFWQD